MSMKQTVVAWKATDRPAILNRVVRDRMRAAVASWDKEDNDVELIFQGGGGTPTQMTLLADPSVMPQIEKLIGRIEATMKARGL